MTHLQRVGGEAEAPVWKFRRPPIGRLLTLNWTCNAWPKNGAGVWIIEGYAEMGTRGERATLRYVNGDQRIRITRNQIDSGGVNIWRKDLRDPEFASEP